MEEDGRNTGMLECWKSRTGMMEGWNDCRNGGMVEGLGHVRFLIFHCRLLIGWNLDLKTDEIICGNLRLDGFSYRI